jgi:hypothetical protein
MGKTLINRKGGSKSKSKTKSKSRIRQMTQLPLEIHQPPSSPTAPTKIIDPLRFLPPWSKLASPPYDFKELNFDFWIDRLSIKYSGIYANIYHFKDFILSLSTYYGLPNFSVKYLTDNLPAYSVVHTGGPYLDMISAHLLLIVGIITYLLEPHYKIIIKGGKAVQLILSDIANSQRQSIHEYESNDIDITVVKTSNHRGISEKEVALQIGYFIQWLTTVEGYIPHLSVLDAPKVTAEGEEDSGSIVKVSYYNPNESVRRPHFTAMMDIGYVSSGLFDKPDKTNKVFKFSFGYVGHYHVNQITDVILEKIHYIMQYTSPEMLANTLLDKFRGSLKRSTHALIEGLKRYGLKTKTRTVYNVEEIMKILIGKYFSIKSEKKPLPEQIALRQHVLDFTGN